MKKITTGRTCRSQRRLPFRANSLVWHHIGLQEAGDGIWSIYFKAALLAKLDERDFILRAPRRQHGRRPALQQPVPPAASLVPILVHAANHESPPALNMDSTKALRDLPEKDAGLTDMQRSGFKVAAGLFLGMAPRRRSA